MRVLQKIAPTLRKSSKDDLKSRKKTFEKTRNWIYVVWDIQN